MTDEPDTERSEEEPLVNEAEAAEAVNEESESMGEPVDPLVHAREESERYRDQLLRTAADFENYRKRAKRDVDDAAQRAKLDVLGQVLPIIDNLERAVSAAGSATDIDAVIQGVQMVLKSFDDAAEGMGLERVVTSGERFDPNVHDAIQQQETSDHPPGTIVAEVVAGWKLGPKLIRPAMVVVAKPPASPEA